MHSHKIFQSLILVLLISVAYQSVALEVIGEVNIRPNGLNANARTISKHPFAENLDEIRSYATLLARIIHELVA